MILEKKSRDEYKHGLLPKKKKTLLETTAVLTHFDYPEDDRDIQNFKLKPIITIPSTLITSLHSKTEISGFCYTARILE